MGGRPLAAKVVGKAVGGEADEQTKVDRLAEWADARHERDAKNGNPGKDIAWHQGEGSRTWNRIDALAKRGNRRASG